MAHHAVIIVPWANE